QRGTLLEQIQDAVKGVLEGETLQHGAEQEVSKIAASQRDKLLSELQDAVKGVLAGKERYSSLTMQNASTLAEHKHKIITEKMTENLARLDGQQKARDGNMELMAYQLDTRNKLLVGLYGFVERREDIGPEFGELTKICTSLGDSGGGWISP
ncbi:MAG TPA: hypothetical protein VMX97_12730, partial [Hyphomicrobiaceae bacterium]|nr:hypothetical protein [Hyphomicrobiaceae bacterium]